MANASTLLRSLIRPCLMLCISLSIITICAGRGYSQRYSGENRPAVEENDFTRTLPQGKWENKALDSYPEIDVQLQIQLIKSSFTEDAELALQLLSHDNARVRAKYAHEIWAQLHLAEQQQEHILWKGRAPLIKQAMENLNHPVPEVRATAAELLSVFGEESSPALETLAILLRDGTTVKENESAALALLNMGEAAKPAAPLLMFAALDHMERRDSVKCAPYCCDALGKLNCAAELKLMYESGHIVGSMSLAAMGYLDPVPEFALQELCRRAATGEGALTGLKGLGRVRPTTERIVAAVSECYDKSDDRMRFYVAVALEQLEPNAPGLKALAEKMLKDDDETVRRTAQEVLEKIQE